jgi:hypothetical protein
MDAVAAATPPHCEACGGALVVFEPPASMKSLDRSRLPTACRRCGQFTIEGKRVSLDSTVQRPVEAVSEEAARRGAEARAQLLANPGLRIEKYFDQVYRAAFAHGVLRAAAWFAPQAKEGRLKRLRQLWQSADWSTSVGDVEIRMQPEAFVEFNQLIEMPGVSRGQDAQGPENADRAG